MKLISKKDAQQLRQKQIDQENLEKSKVDKALSDSIKKFNEWKQRMKEQEAVIEQSLQEKITRYNIQIDDLVEFNMKLREERERMLIPVNKLLAEAKEKHKLAEQRLNECEKLLKDNKLLGEQLKKQENTINKQKQSLTKQQSLLDKTSIKTKKEQESTRVMAEKLANDKLKFEQWKEKEIIKINDRSDEIRIRSNEIKAQILVNQEQKKQNAIENAKLLSERQAVNNAWQELNQLKRKHDRL